ncbi:MAG: dTMP kinase [Candidatus Saccharimonadales bacterium]
MSRGKYIVLEGAQGVGKSTIANMLERELEQRGQAVRKMHEPDGEHDMTAREIRRITQDPQYPMNTRTEVLLYNAARSQSLEVIRVARNEGIICIVDRSYLTTLAVQFYGRGDVQEYQKLNDIINFAVGDMWPDLTIVLDAPVDELQARARKRAENERFDNLDTAMLERIRAGYLWEARQRSLPIVYATGPIEQVFLEVWRHVAVELGLSAELESKPSPLSELITKSPAAKVLETKAAQHEARATQAYYVPPTLPDNVQCDYCDAVETLLSKHQTMSKSLALYFEKNEKASFEVASSRAEAILRPLLPIATADKTVLDAVRTTEKHIFDESYLKTIPANLAANDLGMYFKSAPRNELELVPYILYESLDLPLRALILSVQDWPYEQKAEILQNYLQSYPNGKVLDCAQYEWDSLAPFVDVLPYINSEHTRVRMQMLTPRHGYSTPLDVESADLADAYDDCFDTALQLHSTFVAAGYPQEAQYLTLLGHTQRFNILATARSIHANFLSPEVLEQIQNSHPLLYTKLTGGAV